MLEGMLADIKDTTKIDQNYLFSSPDCLIIQPSLL